MKIFVLEIGFYIVCVSFDFGGFVVVIFWEFDFNVCYGVLCLCELFI